MKNVMKRTVSALLVLTILMSLCVCAFAESASGVVTIKLGETEHGIVTVTVDPKDNSKAIITCEPDRGYLTAALFLTKKDGTPVKLEATETANVFTCTVPAEESTLSVAFRTARVKLNRSELAMISGETFTVRANIDCTDGEIYTRELFGDREVVFASSNPDIVSIDPETGKMTALKMGYSRITATAVAGNGVEGFFYVIVDGDKSPVVGTIQLNAHFEEQLLIDELLPGHSFLIFTNTSGEDITINIPNLYRYYLPTEAFYEAIDTYDGTGYDPATYFVISKDEGKTDENADARAEYAKKLFETRETLEPATYTIKPNDIVTIGNTGDDLGFAGENFEEILERYGKSFEYKKILAELVTGTIDLERYWDRIGQLLTEILYDSATGYNPFVGEADESKGGVCLNGERNVQAKNRDYSRAVGCKTKITEVQLEAMLDYAQYNNYFSMLERNCTAFAAGAWNLVTAAKPQYHMDPNRGGVTSGLAMPLWLRNSILAKGAMLAYDSEIEFYENIGVIKPAKKLGAGCEHTFENGKCTECGATDPNYLDQQNIPITGVLERIIESILSMLRGMFAWLLPTNG